MFRSIIMSEPPAPCNFKCEYCYVPPNFHRRNDTKIITGDDYVRLASKTGADDYLFWLCGIGEPFMMPNFDNIINTLTSNYKTCVVTNLSFFGNSIPEDAANLYPNNFGLYWSVHWNQIKKHNLIDKVVNRVKYVKSCGVHIWPTLVAHPSYNDYLEEIIDIVSALGLKLSLCRYRIEINLLFFYIFSVVHFYVNLRRLIFCVHMAGAILFLLCYWFSAHYLYDDPYIPDDLFFFYQS